MFKWIKYRLTLNWTAARARREIRDELELDGIRFDVGDTVVLHPAYRAKHGDMGVGKVLEVGCRIPRVGGPSTAVRVLFENIPVIPNHHMVGMYFAPCELQYAR